MATNTLAPMGLIASRHFLGAAPNYETTQVKIKAGYATAIGLGDLVKTDITTNVGYIMPATTSETQILGVFAGVLPYFDNTAMQTMHGLNGSWPTNANPSADVLVRVITDPFAVFRAQVSGGPWLESWRGKNINFLTGTNGAPNALGISTLALDASTVATTSTLPFRILGVAGVTGGPQDPANVNPWIEVRLNIAEALNPTGL